MTKDPHHLGTENIGKLLFKQSYPAVIGLLVVSLYNLVDTIFVGRYVGSMGIAALAIVFPIHMIVMSLSQTLGVGASSIISRSLGAKKIKNAKDTFGNFILLSVIISVIITFFSIIFIKELLILFGATDQILQMTIDYSLPLLWGTILIMFTAGSNNIIRAEGQAKYAMFVMISSLSVNIILDPIFIIILGMGLKGAAYATLISYFIGAGVAGYFFLSKKNVLSITFENLKLKLKIIKETFAIGASSLARMVSSSIMIIILNNSLAFYGGEIAIAAFGLINRLFGVVFMPVFGLVQGMQPILGFNYGAGKIKRSLNLIKLSNRVSTIICTSLFVIVFIFTKQLVMIFTTDAELITLSVRAARLIMIVFPIVGFQIIASGMYQSLGKAKKAFFLSILRQIIILIPALLIIPLFFGLDGLFISFPIADILAGIVIGVIMRKDLIKLKKRLNS